VVADGGRIPDGRARPDERPDGLERRHHPPAGPHAQPVPAPALPQRLPLGGPLPGGRPAGVAVRPGHPELLRRHRHRPRGAVALGAQAALPHQCRVALRAHQRRAQRRHRHPPGQPRRHFQALDRPAGENYIAPDEWLALAPATRAPGGRTGRPGWRPTRAPRWRRHPWAPPATRRWAMHPAPMCSKNNLAAAN
jgi:hypothetical protein